MQETGAPAMLIRSKINGRVLCMEAGKEIVDPLLSFFTLPTGAFIRLLHKGGHLKSMGAASDLFESVMKLDYSDLQNVSCKEILLDAVVTLTGAPLSKLLQRTGGIGFKKFDSVYTRGMDHGGFIKDKATYVITDDLKITPTTAAETINLLCKLKVDKCADFESVQTFVGHIEVNNTLCTLDFLPPDPARITDLSEVEYI